MMNQNVNSKSENYQLLIPGFKERVPKLWVEKKSPIDTRKISKEDKRKVFTETFRLINRLKTHNENITLYFFLISLIENRINSLWSYNYWREVNDLKGDRPDIDQIQRYTYFTRITNLYNSNVLKEKNFSEKLIQIFFDRNIKVHQTIWSKKEFTKQQNEVLENVVRKLDKIKRDLMKQQPYFRHFNPRKRIPKK